MNLFISVRECVVGVLIVSLLFVSMGFFIPRAQASESSDIAALKAQLEMLIQVVQQLTQQLAQIQNTSSGDDVLTPATLAGRKMQALDNIRVRSLPSVTGGLVGVQDKYTWGRVLAGPIEKNGYT